MRIKKSLSLVAVFALILSLVFSSSCDSGSKSAEKEINSVVKAFMDDLIDGSYANDDYSSDLCTDESFAALEFSDPDAEDLMLLSFAKIDYLIKKVTGDEDDEEGSCTVNVTVVDLDTIIEDLGDKYMFSDVEEVINSKDVPTTESEITFKLAFDDDEWIISDLADLVKVSGDPFTELILTGEEDIFKEIMEEQFDYDVEDGYLPDNIDVSLGARNKIKTNHVQFVLYEEEEDAEDAFNNWKEVQLEEWKVYDGFEGTVNESGSGSYKKVVVKGEYIGYDINGTEVYTVVIRSGKMLLSATTNNTSESNVKEIDSIIKALGY